MKDFIWNIQNVLADILFFIVEKTGTFWERFFQLAQYSLGQMILDIVLVAILFYWLIKLVQGTRAIHILTGLAILVIIFLVSEKLELIALGWLLRKLLTVMLVAVPIIFQQELRRGLEKLGQTRFFTREREKELDSLINIIVKVCSEMSKSKIGALIVLKGEDSLKEYEETGVRLDAKVSSELLLNIFHPKTPLHDGAVIIEIPKLVAASCILPLSFKSLPGSFGTRHKAALGLAETTDAKIVLVSEEKGTISYAENGKLQKDISPEKLQEELKKSFISKKNTQKRKTHDA
ncbi:TIGR00159 family protein [Candidatus Peregrinibacteria bacterium]|nr:TIGR00159 family protein [Candidatus Peregrinibacteria bacterium]